MLNGVGGAFAGISWEHLSGKLYSFSVLTSTASSRRIYLAFVKDVEKSIVFVFHFLS